MRLHLYLNVAYNSMVFNAHRQRVECQPTLPLFIDRCWISSVGWCILSFTALILYRYSHMLCECNCAVCVCVCVYNGSKAARIIPYEQIPYLDSNYRCHIFIWACFSTVRRFFFSLEHRKLLVGIFWLIPESEHFVYVCARKTWAG